MKKNKIKRFAAIAAATAVVTGMSGNAVWADTVNIDTAYEENYETDYSINSETSLEAQRMEKIDFNLSNGEVQSPKSLCTVGSNGGIKICFGNCTDGQARLVIYTVNGNHIYTIPKSDSIWKTNYISAPEGSSVSYSVAPDLSAGYRSAKGYFEVYYED